MGNFSFSQVDFKEALVSCAGPWTLHFSVRRLPTHISELLEIDRGLTYSFI